MTFLKAHYDSNQLVLDEGAALKPEQKGFFLFSFFQLFFSFYFFFDVLNTDSNDNNRQNKPCFVRISVDSEENVLPFVPGGKANIDSIRD